MNDEMEPVQNTLTIDPRVAYRKSTVCNLCGETHIDFYDADSNFLYSSPCECEWEQEREERSQKLTEMLLGKQRRQENRETAGFSEKEKVMLADPFELTPENRSAEDAAAKWMNRYLKKQTRKGILFSGKPGVGKTRLALRMANTLLDKGFRIYFTTAQRYLNSIKDAFGNDAGKANVKKLAKECDVLFIDDIGAERGTAFDKAEILELLNEQSGYKPVVMTTNLTMDQLDRFYEGKGRIASRIAGATEAVVLMTGEDRRKKGAV